MNVRQLIIENAEKEQMEKIRLDYFANQYKPTFDMNYSSKLMKKYHLENVIIPVNRRLTPQKPLKSKKKRNQINLRRLHQLYLNINRYDFAHSSTMFNYDFLINYLSCGEYQMSDLLYQFSIGAHDPNGELRYLLKEFERSLSIVNEYSMNFSFELIYRLLPCEEQLPDRIVELLEQCLDHCPLKLITDQERIQSLAKYSLSNILDFTLDSHRLFLLTDDEKLYIFYYSYYGMLLVNPWKIKYKKNDPQEQLISFQCQHPYICCVSSKNTVVIVNQEEKRVLMEMVSCQLIAFVNRDHVLIRSLEKNALELWDCTGNQLKCQHYFPENQIERCTFSKSIIAVDFQQSNLISYFSIDQDFQFIRSINENSDHHILLDLSLSFHYSNDHSQALLIFHDENPSKEILEFHSPPKSVIFLPQSRSIVWLTSTSLMLFHPRMKEKIFQPFSIPLSMEYDLVHDHYSSLEFENQTNFLACVNRHERIIDVFEWKYDQEEEKHFYRQLTRVQLDVFIDRFVFTASKVENN